jgi:hypothetical protein
MLDDIGDVPPYPDDGQDYVLVENYGALTWEPFTPTSVPTLQDVLEQSGVAALTTGEIDVTYNYTAARDTILRLNQSSGFFGTINFSGPETSLSFDFNTGRSLLYSDSINTFNSLGVQLDPLNNPGRIELFRNINNSVIFDLNAIVTSTDRIVFFPPFNLDFRSPNPGDVFTFDGTSAGWAAAPGGGIALTDLSVGPEGTPSGDGSLSYDNATGVFTYTPPDLSTYAELGDYIPLDGTDIGSPVTGDIEFSSLSFVATITNTAPLSSQADDGFDFLGFRSLQGGNVEAFVGVQLEDAPLALISYYDDTSGDLSKITVGFSDLIQVGGTNASFRGLEGESYYGANYADNTYVQKLYVDTELGNYIPLPGTDPGSPVTGDIELSNGVKIILNDVDGDVGFIEGRTDGVIEIGQSAYNVEISADTGLVVTYGIQTNAIKGNDGVTNELLIAGNNLGRGLYGIDYYGANYTDNTYIQKKYADDNFIPLPVEGINGQVLTTDGAGTYTWEDGAVGGEETLAETLVFGNITGGNDIVVSAADRIDFSNAGVQELIDLPSGAGINHSGAGIISFQMTEFAMGSPGGAAEFFRIGSTGLLSMGSTSTDGRFQMYDESSGFVFAFNAPDITDNRQFTLPDGDIDWTGGSDGWVMTQQADGSFQPEALPSLGGANLTKDVNQTLHGFSVGDVIRSSGTDGEYALAQADSAANAEVVGIVTEVANVDNFTFTFGGIIDAGIPTGAAGDIIFLSDTVAGGTTLTPPSDNGDVVKPLGVILESGTEMLIFVMRGSIVGSSTPGGGAESFSDLSDYPTDAPGALTNDGLGNLTWEDPGGGLSTIWAEQNDALGGGYEWSFGNGAQTQGNRLVIGYDCTIVRLDLNHAAATSATVDIEVNGVSQGSVSSSSSTTGTAIVSIPVSAGDTIEFNTTSSGGGSANVVSAVLRAAGGVGPQGAQGDPGPQGPAGDSIIITSTTDQQTYDNATPGPNELVVLYSP